MSGFSRFERGAAHRYRDGYQLCIYVDFGKQYDLARDGRFLININVTTDEATASPITVILNWAGLKK